MQAPCGQELRDILNTGKDGSDNAEEIGPSLKMGWDAVEDHNANEKNRKSVYDTDGCDEESGAVSWRRGCRKGVAGFERGCTGEKDEKEK